MGNTLSDWTGVTLAVNSASTYASTACPQTITLSQISMTNSIKTGGNQSIIDSARDNSTFAGRIVFESADATTTPVTRATAKILRLIEKDEQTEDDGTIERIEAGRSLKGTYY